MVSFGPVAAFYAQYPRSKFTWHHTIAYYLYKPVQITVHAVPVLDVPTANYVKFWIRILQSGGSKYSRDPMDIFAESYVVG